MRQSCNKRTQVCAWLFALIDVLKQLLASTDWSNVVDPETAAELTRRLCPWTFDCGVRKENTSGLR